MDDAAQGALEYLLILAGVIMLAVIAIIIVRGQAMPAISRQINQSEGNFTNVLAGLNATQ